MLDCEQTVLTNRQQDLCVEPTTYDTNALLIHWGIRGQIVEAFLIDLLNPGKKRVNNRLLHVTCGVPPSHGWEGTIFLEGDSSHRSLYIPVNPVIRLVEGNPRGGVGPSAWIEGTGDCILG